MKLWLSYYVGIHETIFNKVKFFMITILTTIVSQPHRRADHTG